MINRLYAKLIALYIRRRGMSRFHDWLDWLGGYPYEVAKPEQIIHFFRKYGFNLRRLSTDKRIGNNQFVFCLDEPERNQRIVTQ